MFWPALKQHGIMGINARNRDFIFPNNRRRHYPLVDDKLATKKLAMEAGIPVPQLFGVIEFQNQAGHVKDIASPYFEFAIKPCHGSGGGGITIVKDVLDIGYVKANGEIISHADMRYYINNILSGKYSLGGVHDRAIIEEVVQFDPIFSEITYQGVPDIRIIVYRGIPVMAMLRLPTRASDGKANLHKGGVGVGINMADGTTFGGVQYGKFINDHPETRKPLAGRQIPNWPRLLEMASRFYDITHLGYVGVDIVLDSKKGPMVLEANARPGIAIQIANQCGLLKRTDIVDANDPSAFSLEQRVFFALEYMR